MDKPNQEHQQKQQNHIALNPFPLMLFACGGDQNFAKKVASKLVINLEEVTSKDFSDGDFIVHQTNTIRDRNLFVICQPRKGKNKFIDLSMLEVLVFSLRQGSPKSWITVVMPYLPFSRQDKSSNSREPVLSSIIPLKLQALGADQMVVIKLHNPASRTNFPLIKMEDIDTTDIMIKYIKEKFHDLSDFKLAAPDLGAAKSVRAIARELNLPIVMIDKDRPANVANEVDIMEIIGEVNGYNIILVDDICDTSSTLKKGALSLKQKGAKDLHAVFTHPVLSGKAIQNLQESGFSSIALANTFIIDEKEIIEALPDCTILDMAQRVGQTISNLHNGNSVESLWKENGVKKMLSVH